VAIEIRAAASGDKLCIGERGIVQFRTFDRGVTRHTCVGKQTGEMAVHVIEVVDRALAEHRRSITMVDNWDGSMMATDFREAMTGWFAQHRGVAEVHMLFRSKMFEMGINIANLVLGHRTAHAYAEIARWEAVGREMSGSPDFRREPVDIPADLRARFPRS
jgi:hypothetical protein